MQNDSTEVAIFGCYAESFCLLINCRISGGNFQQINS